MPADPDITVTLLKRRNQLGHAPAAVSQWCQLMGEKKQWWGWRKAPKPFPKRWRGWTKVPGHFPNFTVIFACPWVSRSSDEAEQTLQNPSPVTLPILPAYGQREMVVRLFWPGLSFGPEENGSIHPSLGAKWRQAPGTQDQKHTWSYPKTMSDWVLGGCPLELVNPFSLLLKVPWG